MRKGEVAVNCLSAWPDSSPAPTRAHPPRVTPDPCCHKCGSPRAVSFKPLPEDSALDVAWEITAIIDGTYE